MKKLLIILLSDKFIAFYDFFLQCFLYDNIFRMCIMYYYSALFAK